MLEEWKTISDAPDYAVSNMGRIKRINPDAYGRMKDKIISPKATKLGYIQCSLSTASGRITILVSRSVCCAFHGPAPSSNHQAAHGDGNKSNNCADNLRWATRPENENDKRIHGTLQCGDRHHVVTRPDTITRGSRIGTSKLTEAQVAAIRLDDRSRAEIAAMYGITKSHISDIRSRKIWTHVQ